MFQAKDTLAEPGRRGARPGDGTVIVLFHPQLQTGNVKLDGGLF